MKAETETDAELAAITTCVDTLLPLARQDPVAAVRVLNYLRLRFEEAATQQVIANMQKLRNEMSDLTSHVKREAKEQLAALKQ
jgi:adenylate kinase